MYHLKHNLAKTERHFMPGKDCQHMDLLVIVEDFAISPSPTARNLGMGLDNQLCCTASITTVILAGIVQICSLEHLQDPADPHEGSGRALVPSTRRRPPRLLQLAPGWTASLHGLVHLLFNLLTFFHVTTLNQLCI